MQPSCGGSLVNLEALTTVAQRQITRLPMTLWQQSILATLFRSLASCSTVAAS
jgi:hypothetical protein